LIHKCIISFSALMQAPFPSESDPFKAGTFPIDRQRLPFMGCNHSHRAFKRIHTRPGGPRGILADEVSTAFFSTDIPTKAGFPLFEEPRNRSGNRQIQYDPLLVAILLIKYSVVYQLNSARPPVTPDPDKTGDDFTPVDLSSQWRSHGCR
jgi:hypothetical protein